MATAKVRAFRDGDVQVVPIPPDMSFADGIELTLERCGDVLTLYPTRKAVSGAELVAALDALPAPDYVEVRDVEPLPERPGL